MKKTNVKSSEMIYEYDIAAMMEGYEEETKKAIHKLFRHGKFSDFDFSPENMDVFEGAVGDLEFIAKRVRTVKEALSEGKALRSEND